MLLRGIVCTCPFGPDTPCSMAHYSHLYEKLNNTNNPLICRSLS